MAPPTPVERTIVCPHCQAERVTKAMPNCAMRCPKCRGTYLAPATGERVATPKDPPADPTADPDPPAEAADEPDPDPPAAEAAPGGSVKRRRVSAVTIRPAAPPPTAPKVDDPQPEAPPPAVPAAPAEPPTPSAPDPDGDQSRRRGGWRTRLRRD